MVKTLNLEHCKESVPLRGMAFYTTRQCSRKAGFGPDGEYCRLHAERFADTEPVATWYRARNADYECDITPIAVLKETETFLLVKDGSVARREKKQDSFYKYFPSRKEALEFYRSKVRGLRKRADGLEVSIQKQERP